VRSNALRPNPRAYGRTFSRAPALQVSETSRAIQAHDALYEDGRQPNVTTTCALMSSLLRGSRKHAAAHVPKVLDLWRGLRAQARADGEPLAARAMHAGIHALCRAGRTDEAIRLMDELSARGEPPGVQHAAQRMWRAFEPLSAAWCL
jgi:pentatricopeptide repeat protein